MLTLQFNGYRYHGFQVQKNAITITEVVQNAIEKVFKKRYDIKGCSRTDAMVHANMYCITFFTEQQIPCERVVIALNMHLPPDIAVINCKEVEKDFHPRYSCKGKRYIYKIHNSRIKEPFLYHLVYEYPYPLDDALLNNASKAFIGTHDFAAFCSSGSKVVDTTRTIYDCGVTREGDIVTFYVEGNGFLYNMVRIMVGTLLKIAAGQIKPDAIPAIIASKDRQKAGTTAVPYALYLDKVFY